jgi:diguanylate cyclase (GGDEF)-like protein
VPTRGSPLALIGASLLAPGGGDALVASLRAAFGADAAAMWTIFDDRLCVDGARWCSAEPLALREQVEAAIAAGGELASATGSCHAAAMVGRSGAVLGAVAVGFAPGAAPALGREALGVLAARLASEVSERRRQRRVTSAALTDAPIRDSLGLYSRAFVDEVLELEIARSLREGRPLAAAVVDVIGLARINAQHGHPAGDALLAELDAILRGELRAGDVVGRHRDDALAVLLPDTPIDAAVRALARARDAIQSGPVRVGKTAIRVQVQIGVAALESGERAARVLDRAATAARPGDVAVAAPGTPASAAPVALAPGTIVGNAFRVLHRIGEGGVGLVYRAEDLTLERPVALKLLRRELASDPAFLERFRREATMLAAIQHPHLVQVFTFGDSPEGTFFAMELIEGETLADAMARSHKKGAYLPLARVLRCFEQIASALDRLHEGGILHRDVKPENIALDPFRDRAVLLDVGVAKRLGRGDEAAGTPGFVAPEILTGEPEGPSADVFSLAVTAFHALTFRSPWASFETQPNQVLADPSEAPRRLSDLRPELAPADEVLARAIHYNRRARPASAGELAAQLSAALGPTAAVLDDAAQQAPRTTGRMPSLSPALSPIAALPPLGHEKTLVGFPEMPAVDEQPQTRGVVFRALPRVIGAEYPQWLEALAADAPALAEAFAAERAALGWVDAARFFELLDRLATHAEPDALARRFGRAVVRSSFQRFFPASSLTLTPDRVAQALPVIWGKYHTWGRLRASAIGAQARVVVEGAPKRPPGLAPWIEGVLAQALVLGGGDDVTVAPVEDLAFDVTWRVSR